MSMRKKPLAAAVSDAVASEVQPPAWANDFNLIAQYVMDKVGQEQPATRAVMNEALTAAFNRLRTALGG